MLLASQTQTVTCFWLTVFITVSMAITTSIHLNVTESCQHISINCTLDNVHGLLNCLCRDVIKNCLSNNTENALKINSNDENQTLIIVCNQTDTNYLSCSLLIMTTFNNTFEESCNSSYFCTALTQQAFNSSMVKQCFPGTKDANLECCASSDMTSTTPQNNSTSMAIGDTLDPGVIAGIVVGSLFGALTIGGLLVYLVFKRLKSDKNVHKLDADITSKPYVSKAITSHSFKRYPEDGDYCNLDSLTINQSESSSQDKVNSESKIPNLAIVSSLFIEGLAVSGVFSKTVRASSEISSSEDYSTVDDVSNSDSKLQRQSEKQECIPANVYLNNRIVENKVKGDGLVYEDTTLSLETWKKPNGVALYYNEEPVLHLSSQGMYISILDDSTKQSGLTPGSELSKSSLMNSSERPYYTTSVNVLQLSDSKTSHVVDNEIILRSATPSYVDASSAMPDIRGDIDSAYFELEKVTDDEDDEVSLKEDNDVDKDEHIYEQYS